MKRIQLLNLFIVLGILLFTSCSIYKSGQKKIKNKYLSTETLKVMHYTDALQRLKNQYCNLDKFVGFNGPAIAEPEEISLLETLLGDYNQSLSSGGGIHGHFNDDVLEHEMKCCKPDLPLEACPGETCPCYLLSSDTGHILSNETLQFLEIRSENDELLASANIESEEIKHNIYYYEINLENVTVNTLHFLTFVVFDATSGESKTYSSFISVN